MKSFVFFNSGVVELAPRYRQADGLQEYKKEAQMNVQINFIFWKEELLLPCLLASK